ncbi:hypothetical protein LTR28_007736, partial [Elasticomyces elasticus]
MTSHPPGKCCTIGVKHEGEAKGQMRNIGDISTYFSEPESKQHDLAILLLPDAFGHEAINSQLIADQFAANGYFAVMPDLFHGDPVVLERLAEGFDIMAWLQGPPGHLPPRVDPVVDAVIREMKQNLGVKKIGAVGYCFGGKYVARFLAEGRGVDVGFTAHPSFVTPEELKGIAGPLSIAAAETDAIFPAPKRHETEEILAAMSVPYQINLFSD